LNAIAQISCERFKEMSTHNLVRFPWDINGSYMIANLRMNFRRDSRSLKINCVEAKELSLTRKTRAQPWKYYIHHLFYLASTFFSNFLPFIMASTELFVARTFVIRLKETGKEEKKDKYSRACTLSLSIARLAPNESIANVYYRVNYLIRWLHMWCRNELYLARCAMKVS